jgi:hypothetical protein
MFFFNSPSCKLFWQEFLFSLLSFWNQFSFILFLDLQGSFLLFFFFFFFLLLVFPLNFNKNYQISEIKLWADDVSRISGIKDLSENYEDGSNFLELWASLHVGTALSILQGRGIDSMIGEHG